MVVIRKYICILMSMTINYFLYIHIMIFILIVEIVFVFLDFTEKNLYIGFLIQHKIIVSCECT